MYCVTIFAPNTNITIRYLGVVVIEILLNGLEKNFLVSFSLCCSVLTSTKRKKNAPQNSQSSSVTIKYPQKSQLFHVIPFCGTKTRRDGDRKNISHQQSDKEIYFRREWTENN